MSTMEFKVAKRDRTPINFRIEGDDYEYTFVAPKKARAVLVVLDEPDEAAQVKATFDWLGEGLGPEQTERVIARLRDPDDDLDIDSLSEVVEGLMERASGRPTT